jgi:histidine triad (HIT) family protein
METVFAKIIRKEIPAKIVYEDDLALAFHDIDPKAPIHVLVIPKKPIVSLEDATDEDDALLGHLHRVVRTVARQLGCAESGGQDVMHLHFHLLSGRRMKWPPG